MLLAGLWEVEKRAVQQIHCLGMLGYRRDLGLYRQYGGRWQLPREMRLWLLAVVLLAACLAQAVKVDITAAQQTQQTTENGQHITKRGTGQVAMSEEGRETQETHHKTEETQQTARGRERQTRLEEQREGQRIPHTQGNTEHKGQPSKAEQKQDAQSQQTTEKKLKKGQQQQQATEHRQQTQQPQQPAGRQPQTQQRRILFMYPLGPRSHSSFFSGIIDALVDAGHHVTVVAPYNPSDKVRTVLLEDGDTSVFVKDAFQEHRLEGIFTVAFASSGLCSDQLAKPEVQELLKQKFDVAILSVVFCDCFLSIVHQLKVPYIWATPTGMVVHVAAYTGSPQFPSFVGTKATYMRHPLSFYERAFATLFEASHKVLHYLTLLSMEWECRRRGLCPNDMPHLLDMTSNASLVILNSVRPFELPARPAVPTEIYAGGIHCRPAQPLPQELEAWVQGAGDAGIIFFSMGSIIKASFMPEKTRLALLEAFAALDQRVLWKFDQDTMPDLPPNVRLAKWLPQQDILGHPRLRLFITQGGLMSTTEASCHGVPVLGLPVFTDQYPNMQKIQAEGWGRFLAWEELTGEALRDEILGLMTDSDVKAIVRHRAAMMRDVPMTPAETVVFWLEYVMRHDGAAHLRCPAADLPWYKLYNVDVWATVAATVLLVSYFFLRLTATLCSCLCRLCRPRARKSKND